MSKDKINSFEFCSLIPALTSSAIMGSGFLFLYTKANKSALISMFIGFLLSIAFILLIFKIFNILKDKTFSQKITALFPKWLAFIINIIILLSTLFTATLILHRLISFFNTQFLTDIPKIILSIALLIVPIYASSKNIEVLTRFSSITIFISMFIILFNAVSLVPEVEINNILPIFDTNIKNIIITSVVFALVFSGPSFLLLIIPKDNISNPNKLKKYIIISYVISGIMLLIVNFFTLSTLGIEIIKLYTYPIYIVLKQIFSFSFINSIENITVLVWFFYLMVTTILALIFSKTIFFELFNIKQQKSKNIVVLIINVLITFIPIIAFSNSSVFDNPKFIIIPCIVILLQFFICSIMILVEKLKKK